MKHYLFLSKKEELNTYKKRLLQVLDNLEKGKTPVFNELASAKNDLFESFPYNFLNALFLLGVAVLFNQVKVSETLKVAFLLVANSVCRAIANYLFVRGKHFLRVGLCKRLGLKPTDRVIAAMESLEYQSV